MANGDVVAGSVANEYLEKFDRSIGVSGMEKLQTFPFLQRLGYDGILSFMGEDFHGLWDFYGQMGTYSATDWKTLEKAWVTIVGMVPANTNVIGKLSAVPEMEMSVGPSFQSIYNFGKVFSLSPSDLLSQGSISSKVSLYQDQTAKPNVTSFSGGGATGGASAPALNINSIGGILVVGTPTTINNTLQFDGTYLVWAPAPSGGSGGGSGSVTSIGLSLPLELSVTNSPIISSGTIGAVWINEIANQIFAGPTTGSPGTPGFRFLVAADIPNIVESQVTNLITDLGNKIDTSVLDLDGALTADSDAKIATQKATKTYVDAKVAGAGTVSSVGLTLPTEFTVGGSPVIGSGTLSATWATESANTIMAGPTSGIPTVPNFRILVAGDLPNIAESQVTNLVMDLASKPTAALDTDGTLLADSDANVASQKATKTYVDNRIGGIYTTIGLAIDGVSAAITTPLTRRVQIPFAGTIVGWDVIADQSGSITIEIDKHASSAPPANPVKPNTTTDKISASAPISLSAAESAAGGTSAVSTWTTSIAQWDVIQFNVTSATTVQVVTVGLIIQRS